MIKLVFSKLVHVSFLRLGYHQFYDFNLHLGIFHYDQFFQLGL